MRAILSIDPASALQIASFAADLGIKSTIGLLAACVLVACARRSSAALRHRVWFLTFCGLLLLPALSSVTPKWRVALPWPAFKATESHPSLIHLERQPAVLATDAMHLAPSRSSPTPLTASPAQQNIEFDPLDLADARDRINRVSTAERPTRAKRIIATQPPVDARSTHEGWRQAAGLFVGALTAIWLAGVVVSSWGVFAARRRGRQLWSAAEPIRDPQWLELVEQLRTGMRIKSPVALLESAQVAVPMATGIVRHAVVLPRETEAWPPALRRHVLIHELAHVKRLDVLQQLICRLTAAVYWFHPLAWYGVRRMRLEREIACDDYVLLAGEHPCDYAAELVGIARQLQGMATPWAVSMASGSTLEARVRAMLDRARSHGPLSVRAARILLAVAVAAITLLAAVQPGTPSVRQQQSPGRAEIANVKPPEDTRSIKVASVSLMAAVDGVPKTARALDPAATKSSRNSVKNDATYTFAGTVSDQNGRPVTDARISLSYLIPRRSAESGPPEDVTDAQGKFQFSRKANEFVDLFTSRAWADVKLIAVKEGFGFAARPAVDFEITGRFEAEMKDQIRYPMRQQAADTKNTLMLVPDDVPIRGRLVTAEGRPVAGAKVDVVAVWEGQKGSLDDWEAGMKKHPYWQGISAVYWRYLGAGGMVARNGKRWFRGTQLRDARHAPVAPVLTDSDGRFTMKGLGHERLAEFLVNASGLETVQTFARTRRGEVVKTEFIGEIYPSEFTLVLGPSVAVKGQVRDAKTHQPLAGVRVRSTNSVLLETVTNSAGHYRLEGMPVGSSEFEVLPPSKSNYPPGGVTVKTSAWSQPIVQDLALTAGLIVRGRAVDERTGKGVRGNVAYFAFATNPHLSNSDSLRPYLTEDSVQTDAGGRFEIAALPGPGILGFRAGPAFPYGVGADQVPGPRFERGSGTFKTVPDYCSAESWNLVVPLNPRPDDRELNLDLKLHSGIDISAHVIAADGQPLSEYYVHSTATNFPWLPCTRDRFTVVGYFASETRRLILYHPERNLAAFYDLSGPPPETLEITLRPAGTIVGRVLDETGKPLVNVDIWSDLLFMRGVQGNLTPRDRDRGVVAFSGSGQTFTTDAQGRFQLKGIIPGLKYSAWVSGPMRFNKLTMRGRLGTVFTDVTAKPGEIKQLGDLRLQPAKDNKPERRPGGRRTDRTPGSTPPASSTLEPQRKNGATDNAPLRLAGRVRDVDGKPAAGASVQIHAILGKAFDGAPNESMLLATLTTDAQGRFEHSIDRHRIPPFNALNNKWIRCLATTPGRGLALGTYNNNFNPPPVELRLVPDEPVRGRVLNLEGQPVPGVRVDVTTLQTNTDEMTSLIKMQSARGNVPIPLTGFETVSPTMLPAATTDNDGRFEIVGLGRDRLVSLRLVGPRIAACSLQVAMRPMKAIDVQVNNRSRMYYGSQFEFAAAPSVPVEGTVMDEETGTPIARVIVASHRFDGNFDRSDSDGLISTTSDSQGHFILEGMPLGARNTIKVIPRDVPYQSADDLSVPRGTLPQPIRRDIKLRRCVWAVGRVRDVKTGKPVKGRLFYTPFRSNEIAKHYSRYQSRIQTLLFYRPAGETDDDGRFRIPVVPGRGVVVFKSFEGHYAPGIGAAGIKELIEYKSKRGDNGPTYDDFNPDWFHAVREMSPSADAKQIEIDLAVDSGRDVALKFVDRSEKPLSPVRIWGLDPANPGNQAASKAAIATATVPGENRIIWAKHEATGLMKFLHFTPRPDETERTIILEPPAVLTGRLVSVDLQPLAASIDCDFSLGYNSIGAFPPVQTDAQGRFRFELPGGGPFNVVSRSRRYASIASNLTVQSGERIDIGELVIDFGGRHVTVTAKNPPKRTTPATTGL